MDEDEPDPWGIGSIGNFEEYTKAPLKLPPDVALAMAKKMNFIGFYENKEVPDAVHDQRKTRLQARKRAV